MSTLLDRGLSALRAGNLSQARTWLEYAKLQEPHNAAAALALGSVLIRLRDPAAVALHREIAAGGLLAEALTGLAASLRMVGAHEEAAASRGLALQKFAFAASPQQEAALEQFCAQTAIGGWCALSHGGKLIVSLRPGATAKTVQVSLDGAPLASFSAPDPTVPFRKEIELPALWPTGFRLDVTTEDTPLLGHPIDLATIARVEGVAAAEDGDLVGWAWCPHDPDENPVLTLRAGGKFLRSQVVAAELAPEIQHWRPLARPRRFRVPADLLGRLKNPVEVLGRDGKNLLGAPLDPLAWRESAAYAANPAKIRPPRTKMFAVPVGIAGPRPAGGDVPGACAVVIPVFNARETTLQCIDSVLGTLPAWAGVIVVNDASEDADLVEALDTLAANGKILLHHHTQNTGFPGAANTGLRAAEGRDVVLLNSDTLVPPLWLERLREAAYAAAETGTVTPLSNDATLVSYPDSQNPNPIPDLAETIRLDGFAAGAGWRDPVDLPTAHGFCMFIKRDCLRDTGFLRADIFAQGYGEENDFCIRARHLGWRHVAAANVFVGHVGGQSFGPARVYLRERNLRILNELHPGYDDFITRFLRADPLAPARRAIDAQRWQGFRDGREAVLLVTHGREGGVRRRVRERAEILRTQGFRPVCLWPVAGRQGGRDCVLGDGPDGGTPNLRFSVPAELAALADFLRGDHVARLEVHSLIGHDHRVLGLAGLLGVPYDMVIHDFATFCPRITLVTGGARYCGEPEIAVCEACVADNGQLIEEEISVAFLRARSAAQLAGAARVIAPSADAAARVKRHFAAVSPAVEPWEDVSPPVLQTPTRAGGGVVRVCVIGAIGPEKGFSTLLACVRDARRRALNLAFCVVGYSSDDGRLLKAGDITFTGKYADADAVALIRRQKADIAFLPSIWPETWSYTLSQAWEAGLPVVAFDTGAPAERILSQGGGWLLPLGTPADEINDFFLSKAPAMKNHAKT